MYQLLKNRNGQDCAVTLQVGNMLYSIPFDLDNTDYQAFLKHIAEGGEVLPADNEQTT